MTQYHLAIDEGDIAIQRLARLGCEIVKELHEQDERRTARSKG